MLAAYERWGRVERGLSQATLRIYLRDLRTLGPDPEGLETENLRAWLHARGGGASTVARRLCALRSFYRFLVRTGVRPDDPSQGLDRPKVRPGLPKPVSGLEGKLKGLDPEFTAIAVLLVETGLRIAEAKSLEIPLPVPEQILVLGKGGKERIIPLTAAAQAALTFLQGHISPSVRTIQRRFRAQNFTPHRLRHTLATDLIASGADLGEVQDILGHASPATTRVYASYRTDRLRRALERRDQRSA